MGNHWNNVHYPSSGITSLPRGNNFFSCKQKLLCKVISSLCYVFPFASKGSAFPLLQSLSLDSKLESIFSKKNKKNKRNQNCPNIFQSILCHFFISTNTAPYFFFLFYVEAHYLSKCHLNEYKRHVICCNTIQSLI